jgi:hypothetical protein
MSRASLHLLLLISPRRVLKTKFLIMATLQFLTAFGAGIATHMLYFHRGEHHMYGVRYLQAYTVLSVSAILILTKSYEQPLSTVLILIGPMFLSGLVISLLAYRLFISPLSAFPGPNISRISNLWLSFGVVGKSSHLHIRIQELHAKYGDFVRIGSNDLSIVDPKAVQIIYGNGSKCTKSSWYDQDSPMNSMHTTRSAQVHALRRRVWSPAFSDKAVRGYEKRIQPYVDELARKIEEFKGGVVNVGDWFNFFGYDVMGDVAFGKGFGMIEGGEEHFAIGLLKEAMQAMSLLRELPFCHSLLDWVIRRFNADRMVIQYRHGASGCSLQFLVVVPATGNSSSIVTRHLRIG